jgi:RNA polymerase sigma factor (sigma-70 family)
VEATSTSDAGPLSVLLENHRAFLAYLTRKVGDAFLAEDLLQDAFARVVARPDQAPDEEAVVPWFFRVLRNAAIDRFRRHESASRALEAFARELETVTTVTADTPNAVCQCVSRLANSLKPEYADAIQSIEVEGLPVKAYAEQRGLSAGTAAVRVFRARQALKKRRPVLRCVRRAWLHGLHLRPASVRPRSRRGVMVRPGLR